MHRPNSRNFTSDPGIFKFIKILNYQDQTLGYEFGQNI